MSLLMFGLVLPWLFLGLGAWLGFQFLRQNGRMLLHLEALEQRLSQWPGTGAPESPSKPAPGGPQGLPLGSPAPAFELPDLAGNRQSLADFRGRKLLLIFFNPRCGFCRMMAPGLAELPADGAGGKPVPLVVSTGEAEENRKLFAEHGVRCPVLLQEQMEVASRYQCHGTPMGYLLDEAGNIASEVAVGAEALLALPDRPAAPLAANGNGHAPLGGKRSVAESKLNRNGLAPGTPAPPFRLPRLDGGELSLEEYRGRKVLLVFTDPKCGPCDQLAPQLEREYRGSGQVQVIMVSRGDAAANREKVAQHGVTFPVVLQRQWEISREYGTFGTPAGCLIDAHGLVEAEVAVGAEPILALLRRAAAPASGTARSPPCPCGKMGA
jgi:peroxiredoxin